METYVAILCVIVGAVGGMESEAAMREHVLDGGAAAAANHERTRYESITINKPVMRFDYHASAGHLGQFDDEITGPPSPPLSVRCFCNLPACIATGYMCKSHFGGCFSDLYPHHAPAAAAAYRGRHGCIELLTDRGQRERCQRLPNGSRFPSPAAASAQAQKRTAAAATDEYDHPRSLVHCCHEDMCNHADNQQTKDLINDTTLGDDENRVVGSHINTGYSDSDVWFKAATIAVPICGAVILFGLIALAIRLLKTESSNNTNYKLGCTYLHGKHTNCKHHDHAYCAQVVAEPFLRKEPIIHEHPSAELVYAPPPLRRSTLPAPIITLTKNINERYHHPSTTPTGGKNYNYNLLPQRPRVHEKCYAFENKTVAPSGGCYEPKVNNLVSNVPPPECDTPKHTNLHPNHDTPRQS